MKSHLRGGKERSVSGSATFLENRGDHSSPEKDPKQSTDQEEGSPLPEPGLLGLKATRVERREEGVAQIELVVRRLRGVDPRSSGIRIQRHFWLYICTLWLATEEGDAKDVLERGGGSEGRGRLRRRS